MSFWIQSTPPLFDAYKVLLTLHLTELTPRAHISFSLAFCHNDSDIPSLWRDGKQIKGGTMRGMRTAYSE